VDRKKVTIHRHKSCSCKINYTHPGVKVGRHYRRYGVPADAISVPADSASEIVKFTISIPRESCTNAKAKYSSSVVPPDPSVHFYHCTQHNHNSAVFASPFFPPYFCLIDLRHRFYLLLRVLYWGISDQRHLCYIYRSKVHRSDVKRKKSTEFLRV